MYIYSIQTNSCLNHTANPTADYSKKTDLVIVHHKMRQFWAPHIFFNHQKTIKSLWPLSLSSLMEGTTLELNSTKYLGR